MPSAKHQIDGVSGVLVNPACAIVINKVNIETSIRFIASDGKIKIISKVFPRLADVSKDINKGWDVPPYPLMVMGKELWGKTESAE